MKLKPCVFCKGEVLETGKMIRWQVTCGLCGASGPMRDTKSAAQKAWNGGQDVEESLSALRVIYTWATFENGRTLDPKEVAKLCARALGKEMK